MSWPTLELELLQLMLKPFIKFTYIVLAFSFHIQTNFCLFIHLFFWQGGTPTSCLFYVVNLATMHDLCPVQKLLYNILLL